MNWIENTLWHKWQACPLFRSHFCLLLLLFFTLFTLLVLLVLSHCFKRGSFSPLLFVFVFWYKLNMNLANGILYCLVYFKILSILFFIHFIVTYNFVNKHLSLQKKIFKFQNEWKMTIGLWTQSQQLFDNDYACCVLNWAIIFKWGQWIIHQVDLCIKKPFTRVLNIQKNPEA
jgi:hypothetical protein